LKQTQNATHFNPFRLVNSTLSLAFVCLLGACASTGSSPAVVPSSAPANAALSAPNIAPNIAPNSATHSATRSATPSAPISQASSARMLNGDLSSKAAAPVLKPSDKSSDKSPDTKAATAPKLEALNPSLDAKPAKEPGTTPDKAETSGKLADAGAPPQLSPAEEKDLWERIRRGFSMPELDTPLVAEKERSYLAQPAYLQRMMTRGGRYLYFIVEELERRKMPTELALLPFVESAMNPVAMSSAKASGLWQFIPSTGRAYDLNQNWWVDNRRDVVKSTHAALDYLQKIYAMHGNDWFLALASYNWGEGSVGRAVRSAKAKGLSGDYLSLNMPNETRHYVPKLLALKHIVQRSEALNVSLPTMLNKPYFVTLEKTRPIDLKLAAKFAGMTVDEFVGLNPAHNRPVIAASKNNEIKLPADRVDAFLEAVKKHSSDNLVMASWQPYTVKPGETLSQVAQRGGVPEAEIRKANGLRPESKILPGTNLLVPHAEVADERKVESFVAPRVYEQVNIPSQYHKVSKKETLASIAQRYGLSVASLKAWNGIKKTVAKGMNLLVRPAYAQTVLTAESGERQVVSSTAARSAAVQVKVEDVEEVVEKSKPTKVAVVNPAVKESSGSKNPEKPVASKDKASVKETVKETVKATVKDNAKNASKNSSKTKAASKSTAASKSVVSTKDSKASKGRKLAEAKDDSRKASKSMKSKAQTKVAKDSSKNAQKKQKRV
jgi:membrane-bound lytic murein transglycosylase D